MQPALGRLMLPFLFLILALPVCVFIALMAPAGEAPDEVAHIARANSLLHGGLLGYRRARPDGRVPFDAGVTGDTALVETGFTFTPGLPVTAKKLTPEIIARASAVPWTGQPGFIEISNTAVYLPVFYVPAALGMGVAQLAGLGPYVAILAGRLANALCYGALGTAALLLARRGRLAIFATLVLPMSLWLAGSVNQDGLFIAAAALAAAVLTRTGPEQYWAYPFAGAVTAVLIAIKPAYAPLALAMLTPLAWRSLTLRDALRGCAASALVLLPASAWTTLTMQRVAVPFVRGPAYHPGPLFTGDPAMVFQATDMRAQLDIFLHHPALLVTLPVQSLLGDWDNYVRQTIGVLGTLDVLLPAWTYLSWQAALLAALVAELLRRPEQPPAVPSLGAAAVGLGVVASLFTLFQAQYLSWTLVGQPLIDGVQGRYFIPLLPFIGIALPALGTRVPPPLRWAAAAPLVAMAAIGLGLVPRLVVTTYYLH